jgi:Serine dehydrogenase proteinase
MATQSSEDAVVNRALSHEYVVGNEASASSNFKAGMGPGASLLGELSSNIPVEIGRAAQDLEQVLGMEVWFLVQPGGGSEAGMFDNLGQPTREAFFIARNSLPDEHKIALVIDSPGGDPAAAYRLATFLRDRCGGFVAVVPRWAKSAATLIALGADEIILGDYGELGPLDMQLRDPQSGQLASALNEYQALYELYEFAMGAFGETMRRLRRRHQLTTTELMPSAIRIALGMTRPLLEDLDTVHYTYISRELRLAQEYAIRLLRHNYAEDEAREVARLLSEDYYDHGFVIDAEEAARIGLRTVKRPSAEQGTILDEMALHLDELTIFGRIAERSGNDG